MRALIQQLGELIEGETEARDDGEKRLARRDARAVKAAERRGRKAGGKSKPGGGTERGWEAALTTRSRSWVTP